MWQCRKCGSTERRANGNGCAECHRASARRQAARNRAQDDDSDIPVTPAMRAYLAAFDAYLLARRDGDTAEARRARRARERLLRTLEGL